MTPIGSRLAQAVRELVQVSARAGHLGPLNAGQTKALESAILDRFAEGDYQGGLRAILGQAKTIRGKESVRDVAESALLSLGVDVTATKASWQDALIRLGAGAKTVNVDKPATLRASPIRDVFRGLDFPLDDISRTTLRLHSFQQARIEASLKKALDAPDRTVALRLVEAKLDLSTTPDGVLNGILTAYREGEAWADVARLYESSPAGFKSLPAARREYALALNQLGRSGEARSILDGLVRQGDKSNVTLGLQGRILKDRYDRARAEGDPRAATFLDGAIKAYRAGFEAELGGLYPAVALPVLLEEKGTPAAKKEARAVATVLLYNAERRSRFGEKQYWDAATALEMCCVLGDADKSKAWLAETLASASEPWMRTSTAKNLERLVRVRGADCAPFVQAAIDALKAAPTEPRGARTTPAPARATSTDPREQAMAALLETSYRFGGRSPKWLSGNYAYAGIAHDVRVTPSDVTYFDRVLRGAGIDEIKDPLEASRAMDTLVRAHFATATLEDLQSPEHQYYDRVMPGLAKLMAATRENSQTNVSADWINGLADCRQHAPSKLMLWETWKRARSDELLSGIFEATKRGDGARAGELRGELDRLTPWELRILDAEVVDTRTGKLREEHTLTILVRRGSDTPDGPLSRADEIRLADAFYHQVYPFADGLLTAQVAAPGSKGAPLKLTVPGTSQDGAPITLVPAPYSRDRASQSLDYGQLSFRGQTVATPGWELDVPVEGLDLSKLHDVVDGEVRTALAAAQLAVAITGPATSQPVASS